MDYLEKMQDFVGEKLDSLTYMGIEGKKPKSYKVSPLIDINWKEVLSQPPKNTSETTKFELLYLQEITRDLSVSEVSLVKTVDVDPDRLFMDVLSPEVFNKHRKEFDKLWNMVYNVIMNLKYQYNRPRPYHLAPLMDIDIKVMHTESHLTPAYPSGHAAYAATGAYLFAALYPELSSELFSIPGKVGIGRCLQGVHYPSDNEASMVIVGAIWENIRYKLYPNLISR